METETARAIAKVVRLEQGQEDKLDWSGSARAQTVDPHCQIADRLAPGVTIYVDGWFYRCADRVRLGGDGFDDLVILARIRMAASGAGSGELSLTSVAVLDAIEREGRAAIVAQGKPRRDAIGIPPSAPNPTNLRSNAGLVLA
ncbi:MAG: hypothetical protein K2Y20_13080 [Sphingomonas sp.]|nr:hypothetical protein [Sphingomonas sp.]